MKMKTKQNNWKTHRRTSTVEPKWQCTPWLYEAYKIHSKSKQTNLKYSSYGSRSPYARSHFRTSRELGKTPTDFRHIYSHWIEWAVPYTKRLQLFTIFLYRPVYSDVIVSTRAFVATFNISALFPVFIRILSCSQPFRIIIVRFWLAVHACVCLFDRKDAEKNYSTNGDQT